MDKLPLELLLNVCSFIEHTTDLHNTRLASKRLADASQAFLFPAVYCSNDDTKLATLAVTTKHPVYGKHINTLVFNPSILARYPRFTWYIHQVNRLPRIKNSSYTGPGYVASLKAEYKPEIHRQRHFDPKTVQVQMQEVFSESARFRNLVVSYDSARLRQIIAMIAAASASQNMRV